MSLRRTLPLLTLVAAALLAAAPPASAGNAAVDVVELSGPLDGRLIAFAEDSIIGSDASLVVLKVDSTAVLDESVEGLLELVADPPLPVAIWVGPAPAVAHGGAAQLLLAAPIKGAAPGAFVGYISPTVVGSGADHAAVTARFPSVPADLLDARVEVAGPIPGLVEFVSPSIGQFIIGLDGVVVEIGGEPATLRTAVIETEDGVEAIRPAGETRFSEPGIVTRALRTAIRPEAALLFLALGVGLIVLEVYAAGPGLAAAVGVVALLAAAYGLGSLPTNWWAVALVVVGFLLYVFDFQRNGLGIASLTGTGILTWGGLALIDGGRQMPVVWWAVVLIVVGAGLYFGFALTTLSRSRFSTATIGREHLIGSTGVSLTGFDPEGIVEVRGARWRAVASRTAEIGEGDPVTVVGVEGVVLDVEPS